jgi:hypothetical protein
MWSNPKVPIWRSGQHRRNVATLPCVVCGIEGHTQAAHIGGLEHGKGRALKVPDSRVAALCSDRPGVVGCHTKHDQHHPSMDSYSDAFLIAFTFILLLERGLLEVKK